METYSNQDIIDAVDDEFAFDPVVYSAQIDIRLKDGVVTLSGKVDNLLSKERAGKIASIVKGVSAVVNNLTVSPPALTDDSEVQKNIETALIEDPATNVYKIGVSVKNYVAMLSGTVDSWQGKELCEDTAKGVRGVVAVNSSIKVVSEKSRSDYEILSEIKKALNWSVLVDDKLINVDVNKGNVTLTGAVGSAAEKNQAVEIAYTTGVKSVDASGLKVELWARNDRLRLGKYGNKEDSDIRSAIDQALLLDHRVDVLNIDLDVKNGIVTLRGDVNNLQAKRIAGQIARNTVGVMLVKNRLKVRPKVVSQDDQIASVIQGSLDRNPYTHKDKVLVNVNNGIVKLYGNVDNVFEKNIADDIASKVNGVVAINNYIHVSDQSRPYSFIPYVDPYFGYSFGYNVYTPFYPVKSDPDIKNDIHREFFWSPFVKEDQIKVTVDKGIATLTGTVNSWMEYDSATENAYEGGAVQVNNELKVNR